MASQKYVAKRHTLVLQVKSRKPVLLHGSLSHNNSLKSAENGLVLPGFLLPVALRGAAGVCQESMYNLGRALHQMGLTHLAIHYYQKALTLPGQKLEVNTLYSCHTAYENMTNKAKRAK